MDIDTIQIPFDLPQGIERPTGEPLREGLMRLATGADELTAQQAAQLMDSSAYGVLVRLSRVSTFSEHLPLVPDDIGNLFLPDLNYLIDLYNDINPPDYRLLLSGETVAIP